VIPADAAKVDDINHSVSPGARIRIGKPDTDRKTDRKTKRPCESRAAFDVRLARAGGGRSRRNRGACERCRSELRRPRRVLGRDVAAQRAGARDGGAAPSRAGGGGCQERRWSNSKPGSGWAMRSQSGIGPGSSSQAGGPRAGEHNNAAAAPVAPDHGRQCVQKLQARNRRCPSRACRGHHRHRAGRYAQTNAAPGGVAARRCR